MTTRTAAKPKNLTDILASPWKGSPSYLLGGKNYPPDQIYTTFYNRFFNTMRDFVRDQDPNGLQLINLPALGNRITKPKDLKLESCERGVYPEINFKLGFYLPRERERTTIFRFNAGPQHVFSLPFPHRYFNVHLTVYFNSGAIRIYSTLDRVNYAIRPAHIGFKDTTAGLAYYKNSFLGTWLPNHDYGYYCGNKEFTTNIKTIDELESFDIKDHFDTIFNHYLNSVYNQDLMTAGIQTPASAYICKKLPVVAELERRRRDNSTLTPSAQRDLQLHIEETKRDILLVRKGKYNQVIKGGYADSSYARMFVLSVATVLQEHQDFWEKIRFTSTITIANWNGHVYHDHKDLKTRANIYSNLSKLLSRSVREQNAITT
jgi:hypothetical protein